MGARNLHGSDVRRRFGGRFDPADRRELRENCTLRKGIGQKGWRFSGEANEIAVWWRRRADRFRAHAPNAQRELGYDYRTHGAGSAYERPSGTARYAGV